MTGGERASTALDTAVVGTETLSEGWGTLRRYELADGSSREVYDHGHAVACLAHDPERDAVLLIRQVRLPIALHARDLPGDGDGPHDGLSVEAPAGLIDGSETPEAAMRREMAEETGYRLHDVRQVADLFASPGSLSERMVLFTATYNEEDRVGEGGGLASEGEAIEVLEVPLDDALAMLGDGCIRDLKTAFLLLHLARQKRKPARGD